VRVDHRNPQRVDAVVLGLRDNFRGELLVDFLKGKCESAQIYWGVNPDADKDAIQGFTYPRREIYLYSRRLLAGELACSFGHQQIIHEFSSEKTDWLLICEDNLLLCNLDTVILRLKHTHIHKPSLINFFPNRYNLSLAPFNPSKMRRNFTIPSHTKCYAINRSGVASLIAGYKQWTGHGFQADFPPFYFDAINFYFFKDIRLETDGSSIIGNRQNLKQQSSRFTRGMRFCSKLLELITVTERHVSVRAFFALKVGRLLAEKINT